MRRAKEDRFQGRRGRFFFWGGGWNEGEKIEILLPLMFSSSRQLFCLIFRLIFCEMRIVEKDGERERGEYGVRQKKTKREWNKRGERKRARERRESGREREKKEEKNGEEVMRGQKTCALDPISLLLLLPLHFFPH